MKFIFALAAFIFSLSLQAATPGQSAIVKTDSAMVYDQPTFDGAVISYLPAGKKVQISTKTFGRDIGLFYMIRMPNNKIGYIADIDVHPIKKKKRSKKNDDREEEQDDKNKEEQAEREARQEREAKQEEQKKEESERRVQRDPLPFMTWVGPYYANWGLKEKISGINAQERISVFGMKYTTPKLLANTILDLNFGFHIGAPSYYDQLSVGKPSGYILFLDGEFLSPMLMAEDSLGYFGLGPMINYTAIRVKSVNQTPVDSNEMRLGLALTLGYSHRLGPISGRLEGKYIIEKTQQTVIVLSLQTPL